MERYLHYSRGVCKGSAGVEVNRFRLVSLRDFEGLSSTQAGQARVMGIWRFFGDFGLGLIELSMRDRLTAVCLSCRG
jgi:hypothetical protein